jgi:hypothetical protein
MSRSGYLLLLLIADSRWPRQSSTYPLGTWASSIIAVGHAWGDFVAEVATGKWVADVFLPILVTVATAAVAVAWVRRQMRQDLDLVYRERMLEGLGRLCAKIDGVIEQVSEPDQLSRDSAYMRPVRDLRDSIAVIRAAYGHASLELERTLNTLSELREELSYAIVFAVSLATEQDPPEFVRRVVRQEYAGAISGLKKIRRGLEYWDGKSTAALEEISEVGGGRRSVEEHRERILRALQVARNKLDESSM